MGPPLLIVESGGFLIIKGRFTIYRYWPKCTLVHVGYASQKDILKVVIWLL